MTQREVLELVQNAGSLPALTKALKESNADSAYHNWAMRYYLDVKARKRGVPLKGTFEITPLCNLDCKMCYVHLNKAQLKGQTLLPAEDFERIMSEAIENGMMYACLTGGECLTSPDFDRLYLFLHKKGVQISMLTNAVLLNEERVEFFKKHPPALIQITLYGASEEDYERVTGRRMFETVLGNIRRADEALLPITISITPNEYLMDSTEEVIKLAASTGVDFNVNSSLMKPRAETGRSETVRDLTPEDYVRYFRLQSHLKGQLPPPECADELPKPGTEANEAPKGLRCGGGRSSFNIAWNGEMIPCNRLRHINARPLEIGFSDAWKHINAEAENFPLPCECETCAYRNAAKTCAAAHMDTPGHAEKRQCEWCRAMVKAGFAKLR